tara:strand:- start:276 stop:845 length:570 start_codon:yes stop_codon:yes gene_type:complete
MGGYWVFPGGRVDPEDVQLDAPTNEVTTARHTAAREAHEEAGIKLDPGTLHPICKWTTPESSPIRFSTWFFAAAMTLDGIRVDGVEIHEHRWWRPEAALLAHREGVIQFANPTFALSTRLADKSSVSAALASIDTWPREQLLGRLHPVNGGRVALYAEDCGYQNGVVNCKGPRHRIWMLKSGWEYERKF